MSIDDESSVDQPDPDELSIDTRVENYRTQLESPDYVSDLTSTATSYLADETPFKPGALVEWKDLLRNLVLPDYGAPAVFVRNLTDADYLRAGSGMFGEIRMLDDCLIGFLNGERDFIVLPAESRRLKLWRGAQDAEQDAVSPADPH